MTKGTARAARTRLVLVGADEEWLENERDGLVHDYTTRSSSRSRPAKNTGRCAARANERGDPGEARGWGITSSVGASGCTTWATGYASGLSWPRRPWLPCAPCGPGWTVAPVTGSTCCLRSTGHPGRNRRRQSNTGRTSEIGSANATGATTDQIWAG